MSTENLLRRRLRSGEQTLGLWITLEAPSLTEIAVTLGLDWVVVDMEHGHLGFQHVLEHLRVTRGTATTALVRVPDIQQDLVKRALDLGAHGLLLPLVRGPEDVERCFEYGRYAPRGRRGVGGERAVKWGLGFREYLEQANRETLLIPIIETREAAENAAAILETAGLEAVFFGPADLSASCGFLGEWEGPGVAGQILEIHRQARARGIATGIVSRSIPDARARLEHGFGMVGLGSDAGLLIEALTAKLTALRGSAPPHLWF
jgi:2-keto-3-deoxy-L-rhamnonate aldolase RhmA